MVDFLNVLIVEDVEDDAILTVRALRQAGFNFDWERVETPEELLKALDSRNWDVVISDYYLPKIQAPQVLEIFKQSQLDVPVIVISGAIGESLAVELMRQGANDYFLKGNLSRLGEAVRREIRDVQSRAERRKVELELDLIKERLQLAVESSGMGLWDWAIPTGALSINDRWAEMIGYSLEELEPLSIETWWQNIHPDDLQKANLVLEKYFQKETETYECELRMRHKLGGWVWVLVIGKVIKWAAAGKPLRMTGTHLDISGRKQSVEMFLELNKSLEKRVQARTADLQRSEMHLRETQQIAHLGSWELDVQTRKNSWSMEIFRIFRLDPNFPEPNSEDLLTYFPIDDRKRFLQLIDRAIQLGETFETDLQIIRADGSFGHVFMKAEAVWNADDIVTRLFGIAMDISDRKQSEAQLQQQIKQQILMAEITKRIRQSLDLQTIFDTAVQEMQNFLDTDRIGIFKFYPESDFDDGEIVSEALVEGFPSALAIRVHDHTFGENYAALYANGRAYIVDDIYKNGSQVCHVDILARFQVKANIVMPLLCGEELWGLLCIHQCGTTRHWLQHEINFCYQIADQLAIAIYQANLLEQAKQELTEKQQAETMLTESYQQLAHTNEELIRATRLKDEFLANMSHELRTPLNAILGMTEAMQERVLGAVSDRQIKALLTIERSGNHLLSLINDILDLAKIESGKITLDLTATSIQMLCQSSLVFIRQQAHQKSIQLIEEIPKDLPDLMVDERRIRQVLINLLNNAVKFTPEGGSITLEISRLTPEQMPAIATTSTMVYLRVAVIDTGIGISAENISKLFQPFVQIDSSLNRKYEGTGLGLALVKRIVELHGGQVRLTSERGVGSCFVFELPYNESSSSSLNLSLEPVLKAEDTPEKSELDPTWSPLILIAEDNEANIITFSGYLEAKGYRMLLARDGQQAIALAKAHQPDLILMDIQMPCIDGIEATQQIRRDPNLIDIPIIALTALAMAGDRERCLESGANDYLAKPVKLKALDQMIQTYFKDISFPVKN
ncbi:circadian input kinase A [Pseudanabaena sp. lw0831]|uniref:response regulator n=1 Tax=Pseudanabaena sp. lw0831 TaxID=1357935 RepID=UPI001915E801|nr:response regulator [Pseudanabaena sp. lw0831]GBO52820.1 circadian input kinase A [Pseudanabaena sp. lw0831]